MAVIRPEIETDPAELEQIAIQYLMDALPGWEPAAGDLMTWLISAHAQMIAEERDIAADVPLQQILRPFGEQVHLVAPKLALPATVPATVTMRDQAGYTVPAGTEVLVRTAGDDGVTMVVVRDATLAPNRGTTVTVQLEAAPGREGTAGNGLDSDNAIVPLRSLEFIRSIAITGTDVSSGGRDAETDEEYLERLVDTLALTSSTPILPEDFAAIARQVDGVDRALAINLTISRPKIVEYWNYLGGFDGYLVEEFGGDHGRMSWGEDGSATASEIRAELRKMEPWVEVSGTNPFYIYNIDGYLTDTDYNGPPIDGWTVIQEGEYQVEAERAVTVVVADEDGQTPPASVLAEVETTLESMREANWRLSVIGPTLTDISVSFSAVAWADYDTTSVRDAAIAALTSYLSPANWGRGQSSDASDSTWVQEPVVRYLEVAQALNEVPGIRYIRSLTLNGYSADVQLLGRATLPLARVAGTVTGG